MAKKNAQKKTCFDCFHCKACHLWCNSISATVAPKCPEFEPVRYATAKDLHDMLLLKREKEGASDDNP